MDSGIGSEFILLAILITLNAFFSASEMAMVSVPRLRMKQLMESGNETAGLVLRLADDSSRLLATVQIGVTLMGFLASATARSSAATRCSSRRCASARAARRAPGRW